MYIRNKKVKGISYAYLVESRWDKEKKQSCQTVIKYLGRFDNLKIDKLSKDELAILSKHLNEKHLKKDPLDSHIRKYKQIKDKQDEKIMRKRITEQRKIERAQNKVLEDLEMDKNQFLNRFGWRNSISKPIGRININT